MCFSLAYCSKQLRSKHRRLEDPPTHLSRSSLQRCPLQPKRSHGHEHARLWRPRLDHGQKLPLMGQSRSVFSDGSPTPGNRRLTHRPRKSHHMGSCGWIDAGHGIYGSVQKIASSYSRTEHHSMADASDLPRHHRPNARYEVANRGLPPIHPPK